jgi:hypothetical protein
MTSVSDSSPRRQPNRARVSAASPEHDLATFSAAGRASGPERGEAAAEGQASVPPASGARSYPAGSVSTPAQGTYRTRRTERRKAERQAAEHRAGDADEHVLAADRVRTERRARRYLVRDTLNKVSSNKRARNCGWAPHGKSGERPSVAVQGGVAHWRGVQTCGLLASCPVCGPKIRHRRAQEISEVSRRWIDAGNSMVMVTPTLPHSFGMGLAMLLTVLASAFRCVSRGRPYRRLCDEAGIAGFARSLEVTFGWENGFHPHLHILLLVRGDLDAEKLCKIILYYRSAWSRFVQRHGLAKPSDRFGVDVQPCYNAHDAAEYVTKTQDGKNVASELARGDMKSAGEGRYAPFELLEAFTAAVERARGDDPDPVAVAARKESAELARAFLGKWHEYERGMFGHKIITTSKGFRALAEEVGAGTEEKSDEEIAAEEVGGELVIEAEPAAMSQIRKVRGLRHRMLEAYEEHGLEGVIALVNRHGFGVAHYEGWDAPLILARRSDEIPATVERKDRTDLSKYAMSLRRLVGRDSS